MIPVVSLISLQSFGHFFQNNPSEATPNIQFNIKKLIILLKTHLKYSFNKKITIKQPDIIFKKENQQKSNLSVAYLLSSWAV